MRPARLTLAALLVTLFASCGDSGNPRLTSSGNPPPPITGGDGGVFAPPVSPPVKDLGAVTNPNAGTAVGGGGSGHGSSPGNGGNGGGNGGPPGNSNSGGGGGNGGPGNGNPPGSAVPEPGTLLLVGTGLAVAATLRRRRQDA
ncbi:MAG: PEP-CTERM sorting domain-containing protein, partial [Planctomycetes bacterium]|nr:PEP-CTERM sorting domain-containing protein [Planctomycetota bacterium]